MPRKPPPGDQPTLFPLDPDDSPEPEKPLNSPSNGDHHAVQDHSPRNAERTDGAARTATADPPPHADNGDLREGTEGQPRDLEGDAREVPARKPSQPDLFGSNGNGTQGTGGSFAQRVSSGRN